MIINRVEILIIDERFKWKLFANINLWFGQSFDLIVLCKLLVYVLNRSRVKAQINSRSSNLKLNQIFQWLGRVKRN